METTKMGYIGTIGYIWIGFGLGFRVFGFRPVWGSGFRILSLGFRVLGLGRAWCPKSYAALVRTRSYVPPEMRRA